MMIDKENWQRFFSGYVVRDCTIGFEEGRLGFLLFEEIDEDASLDEGWQIRLIAVKLENPMETRFFSLSTNGLEMGAQLASAWSPAQPEFVCGAISRAVYSYRPKEYKGREDDIPFTSAGKLKPDAYSEFDSAILKTVRVGCTVFALGSAFRIFERLSGQRWREHQDIPIPAAFGSSDRDTALHAIGNTEFRDLAGTTISDMYAVGSEGAVWQRAKGHWRSVSSPTNSDLFTVAVAPDGIAYITDRRGSV